MTLENIYKLTDFISLKENNGNLMEMDDFNIFIQGKYPEFIKEQIEIYEQYQNNPTLKQSVLSSKYLNALIANSNITISSGYGSLPATYNYWKSATGQYNSVNKTIDLVSEEEKDYRITTSVGKRAEQYPCAVLRGSNVYVWPKTITPVNLTFYKDPVTPYCDYYINSGDEIVFLSAGQTGVTIGANETYSDGRSSVTIDSATVELDIPSDTHFEFMNHLLSALGIRIGMEAIVQYAELQQQKAKSA